MDDEEAAEKTEDDIENGSKNKLTCCGKHINFGSKNSKKSSHEAIEMDSKNGNLTKKNNTGNEANTEGEKTLNNSEKNTTKVNVKGDKQDTKETNIV